jgi:hypothetical protein
MESFIERLRAKPDHIRRRIAFWSSFGITAVIAVFWLASITSIGTNAQGAIASTFGRRVAPPAQSLTANVGAILNDIKELIFTSKKVIYSEIQAVPGK